MAGAGYKLFNTGDVLTAAQVNTYLQEQAVMVFADATARTTALSGVLAEGMITYLKSDDKVYKYTGSAWVEVGGGTSPLTTKGDLYTYSTADARLGVGTNNQQLLADSAQATGLKWAASPTSTLTTTGDILYASSANTLARLGIGTSGQVLTVASGIPSWATASSTTPACVGCTVYNSSDQSISSGVATAVTWNTEVFDTDAFHSTSTNTSRMTIPSGKDGKYRIDAMWQWSANSTTGYRAMYLYKNGSLVFTSTNVGSTTAQEQNTMVYIDTAVATDYYELYALHNKGSNESVRLSSSYGRYSITFLGA